MLSSGFNFDNTYARDLEGFYAPGIADPAPAPKLLKLNTGLATIKADGSYAQIYKKWFLAEAPALPAQ